MTTRTLKAVFSAGAFYNAHVPDAPFSGAGSLMVSHKGEIKEAVTVRTFYNPRGSGLQPVRACLWIKGVDGFCRSGRGRASGCGYHKESAAIAEAVRSAGVELFGRPARYGRGDEKPDLTRRFEFGGTGSSGYEEIFATIARAAGYRGRMAWVSHNL